MGRLRGKEAGGAGSRARGSMAVRAAAAAAAERVRRAACLKAARGGTFLAGSTSVSESPSWMMPRRALCLLKKEEADWYAYSLVKEVIGGSGETDLGATSAS